MTLYPISNPPKHKRPSHAREDASSPETGHQPISLIGLVHTCKIIRAEFRPWWMNQHRIQMLDNEQYFQTYGKQMVRPRKGEVNRWDTLRIRVPESGSYYRSCYVDAISIFRLKANHQDTTIMLEDTSRGKDSRIDTLSKLLDNRNSLWLKCIRSGVFTQICIKLRDTYWSVPVVSLLIVVKYKYVEDWMMAGPCHNPIQPPNADLARLGLDGDGFLIHFGVHY